MATTKITITLDPGEYATLRHELKEARERYEGKRKSPDNSSDERREAGERVLRLDTLMKDI